MQAAFLVIMDGVSPGNTRTGIRDTIRERLAVDGSVLQPVAVLPLDAGGFQWHVGDGEIAVRNLPYGHRD